jgi:hypothetical protein
MKIPIGHKVLNLEELYQVSCLGADQAQVVIDSQLYAELSTAAPKDKATSEFAPLENAKFSVQ